MVLYTKWFVNHNKFYINIGMFNSILMGYTYGKKYFYRHQASSRVSESKNSGKFKIYFTF